MSIDPKFISIYGARVHNLKNISIDIPRDKLVVFTGKSGSGKSSLAFDTIHAEGQRRYLDTFNAYARQFIGDMERPDVDKITGLSPVVAIEQKTTSKNPRSTVGTITEIYDYLRLLYSRIGVAYSYKTGEKMVCFTEKQILKLLTDDFFNKKILILSPLVRGRKGSYIDLFHRLFKRGYLKVRIDGEIVELTSSIHLDRYKNHDIELVIDRLTVVKENYNRLKDSLTLAMNQGEGVIMIIEKDTDNIRYFSKHLMCPTTGIAYKKPEPNSFSFNSPKGACSSCNGLGNILEVDINKIVPDSSLSIKNGAIIPINNKRSKWIIQQIELIGKKFNFTLDTPFCDIQKEGTDAIFYGLKTNLKVKYKLAGIAKDYIIDFEGIISFIDNQAYNSGIKSINKWAVRYMSAHDCQTCNGTRLNVESSNFKVAGKYINDVVNMDILSFSSWLATITSCLNNKEILISKQIVKELSKRVQFIINVGLSYLTLNRNTRTLSGGEAQRIRLATQIGTKLTNVLYILDEPSIGLHQKDNLQLISALKGLRNIGNSVIVVEHDKEMIQAADFIVDLGPGAGNHGGEIVAQGSYQQILNKNNITSQFLNGEKQICIKKRRSGNGKFIDLYGARGNNLKDITVNIPLGLICCITGVSGSGKSTLINETLYPILNKHFFRACKKLQSSKNQTYNSI